MPDRAARIAGTFYPADPHELRTSVTHYLDTDTASLPSNALMLLLPHAGHVYCGHIIGGTLARVRLPESIILLCPNHTGQGHPLAVWPDGQWHTPLGSVTVDTELTSSLIHCHCGYTADTAAHLNEHSLEVLLPFIQCHSPHSRIVPVSVSMNDINALHTAGAATGRLIAERRTHGHSTLIIVSSDMNHFESHNETLRKDSMALAALLALQPEVLLDTVTKNNITMCGVLPAILGLYAAMQQKTCTANLIHYTTSGETTRDMHTVVGYCGVLVE